LSSLRACDESTPPKASSNEIAAAVLSELFWLGRVGAFGAIDPVEKVSSNKNGFVVSTDDCGSAPFLTGVP